MIFGGGSSNLFNLFFVFLSLFFHEKNILLQEKSIERQFYISILLLKTIVTYTLISIVIYNKSYKSITYERFSIPCSDLIKLSIYRAAMLVMITIVVFFIMLCVSSLYFSIVLFVASALMCISLLGTSLFFLDLYQNGY